MMATVERTALPIQLGMVLEEVLELMAIDNILPIIQIAAYMTLLIIIRIIITLLPVAE